MDVFWIVRHRALPQILKKIKVVWDLTLTGETRDSFGKMGATRDCVERESGGILCAHEKSYMSQHLGGACHLQMSKRRRKLTPEA